MEDLLKILNRAFYPFKDITPDFVPALAKYLNLRFQGKVANNGEPYLDYVADIAQRLSELNLDRVSIMAGILWQVYNVMADPKIELERLFGEEVADFAERVCKIAEIDYKEGPRTQAEQFRRLILAMARDIRVVFIRLADRAHLLDIMSKYPTPDPLKDAKECREWYAPLANRLGIGRIKYEIEDLSLNILEPVIFSDLTRRIQSRSAGRERYLERIKGIIQGRLDNESICAQIKGRLKHIDSIHRKMVVQNIPFDEVYDIIGIRVITQTEKDCYSVLGIVHSLWKPIPKRFKDYIAVPKRNAYKSIHTSVIGIGSSPLEIQIRTEEMDQVAEMGIAAHWRYKEKGGKDRSLDSKFTWLRQVVQMMHDESDPADIMEEVRVDLFPDEVYVFTPEGDVKCLPSGATPVDFAYTIHSDIGNRCSGAYVNQQMVPLKTCLKSGDIVRIITQANSRPSPNWLQFVKTSSAKNRIRKYLREQELDKSLLVGRDLLKKALRRQRISIPKVYESKELLTVAGKMGFQKQNELIAALGFGEITTHQILNRLAVLLAEDEQPELITPAPVVASKKPRGIVNIGGSSDMLVHFARCCEPIPGEPIVGFITCGRGITIHAKSCPNLKKLDTKRMLSADWEAADKPSYPVRIVFKAEYTPTLLQEMTRILVEHKAVILSQSMDRQKKSRHKVRGEFQIEVTELVKVKNLIQDMNKVPGILVISRMLSR